MKQDSKLALVTGAGHGIGRAIALRLARAGFNIVVHYGSNADDAAQVVQEVEGMGRKATSVQADIGDVLAIEALFEHVDRQEGHLEVLVNSAGVVQPTPLAELTPETFDRMFAVNVRGPALVAREAAERMGQGGRMVNISSSRVHFPAAGTTCYAGSKAAIEMLTAVWAVELAAKGITVNAVAPGPTSPGMIDRAPEKLREAARNSSPFARLGSADEIADTVGFLCSEEAGWITGQVLLVNGGGTI